MALHGDTGTRPRPYAAPLALPCRYNQGGCHSSPGDHAATAQASHGSESFSPGSL